ncbi:TSUP family transporter [Reinekea marina]|uniref:Probable membrane transporter protein n=1 Tax=Reinekea marina TaxID=1310421 RepID=A0ABV7WU02_9GAMM
MDISIELIVLLFAVAAVAGWVDTLAGGGGLIVLPALMMTGISPVSALATNKCQGFIGTFTATITLISKRKLSTAGLWPLMLMSGLGAMLGTLLIQLIDTQWLNWAVPVLLVLVAMYFLMSPNLGAVEKTPKISHQKWKNTAVPAIGFYDGFFGPGTGSFFAASSVILRGKNLIDATVMAKPLNFTSNIASLVVFAFGGQVMWTLGFVMMVGQLLGAFVGAHSIYWGGAKLIRPLVIVMCLAMSIKQIVSLL